MDELDKMLAERASQGQYKVDDHIDALLAARAAQKDEPTSTPAKEPSALENIGRQLGLTVRHVVSGAAALPAMASDAITGPINAGLDAVLGQGHGFRFQKAEHALDNVMTAAGLPVPENATERVVGDISQALAGTGGAIAAGGVLAKSASPIAAKVGELLAAAPSTQLASAAAGSAASGTTRELGGSPLAQAAAGLSAGVTPGLLVPTPSKVSPQMQEAARKAYEAGFVVNPADLGAGIGAEIASGIGGKIKMAQAASAKNQPVTNALAKKALGLEDSADLSYDVLEDIRKQAAQRYEAVSGAGLVMPGSKYEKDLDAAIAPFLSQVKSFPDRPIPAVVKDVQSLKTPQFDAGDGINTIKVLRSEAESAYRSGDNLAGAGYKKAANALETAIEDHLVGLGAPAQSMLTDYRDARKLIAKTYSVQKALNTTSGNVDAQKLGAALAKGAPLSDELLQIAEFGQAFPKFAQALKETPKNFSALDAITASTGANIAPTLTGKALAVGATVARPIVREVMLSGPVQRRVVDTVGNNGTGIGLNDAFPSIATHLAAGIPAQTQEQKTASDIAAIGSAKSVDEAIAAATNATTASAPPITAAFSSDGTFRISGNPVEILSSLKANGINAIPVRGGVIVSRSHAMKAAQIFGQ